MIFESTVTFFRALVPINLAHSSKSIYSNDECGYYSDDKECEDGSVEENVLVSHLDRIKENAWTHVVPLYPQQLCCILIEFGVIPQLITYYIGI